MLTRFRLLRSMVVLSMLMASALILSASRFYAQDCPKPRLEIGGQGRVTPGEPNRMRSTPSTAGEQVGEIPAGSVFDVLDGPECADGFLWWHVEFDGVIGWTAEGNSDAYFAEPIGLTGVSAVAWSADGERIAVGISNGVYLFNTDDFDALPTLLLEGSVVDDLAFNPVAANLLAVRQQGSEYPSATLYDVTTGEERYSIVPERPAATFNSLTFTADGTRIALNSDGFIEVHEPEASRMIFSFQLQVDPPISIGTISPDGLLLGAYNGDSVAVMPVGSTRDSLIYFDRETVDAAVLAMAFSPDNQNLVVGDEAGNLQKWEVATGERTSFIRGERSTSSNRINDLLFDAANTMIYTAESDPHAVIRAFNAQTLATANALDFGPGTSAALAVAISPDGTQLAVAVDNTVRIVDIATFTEVAQVVLRLN